MELENVFEVILMLISLAISLAPFIMFWVIILAVFILKKGSKYNKLITSSITILSIGVIIIIAYGGIYLSNKSLNQAEEETSQNADGYTIEKYKVILNVNENNSIDVTESIIVDFYSYGKHGILKFIPSWLKYTDKNGNTESRKATIKNLRAVGEEYSLDKENGKDRIKIGNANYTVNPGLHTYEIKYTYDFGADPYKGFDEFIFHAFGDYWGTRINNASIEIHLPKEVDVNDKLHFYTDKYRKNDVTKYIDYYVYGNTIYANVSNNINLTKALTIDLELPEGYFPNSGNNYGYVSLCISFICIILAILIIKMWAKNGKDLDKVPETVEFYPPEHLDSAEIGYLYKKDVGRKLTISLIIELASKGFIKITESEDKTTQTIVKATSTDVDKYINREVKIIKMKDSETLPRKSYKLLMDEEYFPDNKTENVISNKVSEFYKDADYLIKNEYLKVEYDTIEKYSEQELNEIKEKLSNDEFKNKPQMTVNERLVYDKLFSESEETDLSKNYSFYEIFSKVAENVRNKFDDKINDLVAYKSMLISSLIFLISTILWGISFYGFEDLNPKFKVLYLISFIALIVMFVFSILMKRKNLYGEQIKAKISGFKRYLELAEKEQIEALVEKNPNYFYDILPYAYVLGVSTKWTEKFENIPVPTNDMGNFDYSTVSSIDSLYNSVYIPSSSGSRLFRRFFLWWWFFMWRRMFVLRWWRFMVREFALQWHLSEICNLKCKHCYQEKHKPIQLNYEELLSILNQYKELLKKLNIKGHINLTGGEPLCCPYFFNILEEFKKDADLYSFSILTNGTLITEEIAERISKYKPNYVQVSLEGGKSTNDFVRGKGVYKKVANAIKLLRKYGMYVSVSFTATKINYKEFPKVVKFAEKNGANIVWSDRFIPLGTEYDKEFQMRLVETNEYLKIMEDERIKLKLRKSKMDIAMYRALQFQMTNDYPYTCTAGKKLLTVMENGDLVPCRRMPIVVGNLLKENMIDLYENSDILKELQKDTTPDECKKCEYSNSCSGGLKCLTYAIYKDLNHKDIGCNIN